MRFITGDMRRSPATDVAAATPPIIAPVTPQDITSWPVSHSPGRGARVHRAEK